MAFRRVIHGGNSFFRVIHPPLGCSVAEREKAREKQLARVKTRRKERGSPRPGRVAVENRAGERELSVVASQRRS